MEVEQGSWKGRKKRMKRSEIARSRMASGPSAMTVLCPPAPCPSLVDTYPMFAAMTGWRWPMLRVVGAPREKGSWGGKGRGSSDESTARQISPVSLSLPSCPAAGGAMRVSLLTCLSRFVATTKGANQTKTGLRVHGDIQSQKSAPRLKALSQFWKIN